MQVGAAPRRHLNRVPAPSAAAGRAASLSNLQTSAPQALFARCSDRPGGCSRCLSRQLMQPCRPSCLRWKGRGKSAAAQRAVHMPALRAQARWVLPPARAPYHTAAAPLPASAAAAAAPARKRRPSEPSVAGAERRPGEQRWWPPPRLPAGLTEVLAGMQGLLQAWQQARCAERRQQPPAPACSSGRVRGPVCNVSGRCTGAARIVLDSRKRILRLVASVQRISIGLTGAGGRRAGRQRRSGPVCSISRAYDRCGRRCGVSQQRKQGAWALFDTQVLLCVLRWGFLTRTFFQCIEPASRTYNSIRSLFLHCCPQVASYLFEHWAIWRPQSRLRNLAR